MRAIGDKVQLRYDCGNGSLSGIFLSEQSATRVMVPIVALKDKHYDYTVELPSGYRLGVDERDIA